MKLYLICDNEQILTGHRLAGIKGVIVENAAEAAGRLNEAAADCECAAVFINKRTADMFRSELNTFRKSHTMPLLLEIPDENSSSADESAAAQYIKNTIGVII